MPEIDSKQEATNSLVDNTIVCPRCVTSRVAKSRLRELDKLRMQFIPVRPYRCLHCYHRFWVIEGFTAEKRRVWTWLIILIVLISLIALLVIPAPQRTSATESQGKNNIQQTQIAKNHQDAAPESVIKPVVATTAAADLATVSARLEEYGWAVKGDEELQQSVEPVASVETPTELLAAVDKSVLELYQTASEVTPEERESLLKVTMARHMKQWRSAWQDGDIKAYLAKYSDRFVPSNDQTLEQWRAIRTKRVDPQKKIKLELSKFQVDFFDDYQTISINFDQRYQSNSYVDNSRKRIVWVKQDETWKIASEREIE